MSRTLEILARLDGSWSPQDGLDVIRTCFHEAGHFVIADHYGLHPETFIGDKGCGATRHTPGTPAQESAISWGGTAAECLAGLDDPQRPRPAAPITDQPWKWWSQFVESGGLQRMSPSDALGTMQGGCSYPSLCEAVSILRARRAELAIRADELARCFRPLAVLHRRSPTANEGCVHSWVIATEAAS
jgi:hypothetical protein